MKTRERKRVPPWVVMYVGMVAAVVLAERDSRIADQSPVSPVVVETMQPKLDMDTLSRRSDL